MLPPKQLPHKAMPAAIEKEKHLHFDHADITVRGGAGGHGAVIRLPGPGEGPRLPKDSDGNFMLPEGGGRGGDVLLEVDPSLSDLLHLHSRGELSAQRGSDSEGLANYGRDRKRWAKRAEEGGNRRDARLNNAPSLVIKVPPGTFVRSKAGKMLGDLVSPGQQLCVATGGAGGPCVLADEQLNRHKRGGRRGRRGAFRAEEEDVLQLSPAELKEMTRGKPAKQLGLQLLLRTVADVGFVGFPNAGKSTLLAAISRASPEIAPFPFTTLMPNLGAMTSDVPGEAAVAPTVLADLPGLVEGAHQGRGMGRLFLRHLRRVKLVLYVIDSSSTEPPAAEQYAALRRELKLYNPEYLQRPHVVALNKLDLAWEAGGQPEFDAARKRLTREVLASAMGAAGETSPPLAVIPLSGLRGRGLKILRDAIGAALEAHN